MPEPIILTALQLRQLADYAASLRAPGGDPIYAVAVEDNGTPSLGIVQGAVGTPAPMDALVEFDTSDQQPHREAVSVSIQSAHMAGPTTLQQYDAVFWSEAAVEKFVLPYYASKSLWSAAFVLQTLSRKWYGFVPGQAGEDAAAVGGGDIPFALAHLPTSDYVGIGDGGVDRMSLTEPGGNLHLLYSNPDGTVRAESLTEVLKEAALAPR